jgi:hypothetical protein
VALVVAAGGAKLLRVVGADARLLVAVRVLAVERLDPAVINPR